MSNNGLLAVLGVVRLVYGIYLRHKRGSHTPTVRPKYIPYSYMDQVGSLHTNPKAVEFGLRV